VTFRLVAVLWQTVSILPYHVARPLCWGDRVGTHRSVQYNYHRGGRDNYRSGAGDKPGSSQGAILYCSLCPAGLYLPPMGSHCAANFPSKCCLHRIAQSIQCPQSLLVCGYVFCSSPFKTQQSQTAFLKKWREAPADCTPLCARTEKPKSKSKSKSKSCYDRRSVGQSVWCQAPIWNPRPISPWDFLLDSYCLCCSALFDERTNLSFGSLLSLSVYNESVCKWGIYIRYLHYLCLTQFRDVYTI
jgi:hypothetical protein